MSGQEERMKVRNVMAVAGVAAIGALSGAAAGCGSDDVEDAQDQVNSIQDQVNSVQDEAEKQLDSVENKTDSIQQKGEDIEDAATSPSGGTQGGGKPGSGGAYSP